MDRSRDLGNNNHLVAPWHLGILAMVGWWDELGASEEVVQKEEMKSLSSLTSDARCAKEVGGDGQKWREKFEESRISCLHGSLNNQATELLQ